MNRDWAIDRPVRSSYLVFGKPQLLDTEIEEVIATLRSGWIGSGPRAAAFEDAFRAYVGSPHAVALNSCTAALHLALIAIGIESGDEVVVPSLTFAATANAVIHAGGTPVLADVRRETMCLDPEDLERRIGPRTKAVVPVHFAGRACDLAAIGEVVRDRHVAVVEDCAHAIETMYRGRHVGTFGAFGAFSFYVTKNVVTGEGGMLVTSDADSARRIKRLALHGLDADAWQRYSDAGFRHYEVVEPGFKYNMTDLQAALGVHQLARAELNLLRREEIWRRYDDAFQALPVFLPAPAESGTRHARHLYTLALDLDRLVVGRDDVLQALHRQGIGTGVHYRALHLHSYYRRTLRLEPDDLPHSRWISERTLSLPLSPALSDADVEDVIFAVSRTLRHFAGR